MMNIISTYRKVLIRLILIIVLIEVGSNWSVYLGNFHPERVYQNVPSEHHVTQYCEAINRRNTKLAKSSINDIITTVTFSKPLSLDEYADYLGKYKVDVRAINYRLLELDGTRVTGLMLVQRSDLDWIENNLDMVSEYESEFIGITSLYCFVDSDQLAKLSDDPLTYLADTSRDASFIGLIRPKNPYRNIFRLISSSLASTFVSDIVWHLEDLGIGGYDYIRCRIF